MPSLTWSPISIREFNVQVIPVPSPVSGTAFQHRNVIGIGTDKAAGRNCQDPLFGESNTAGGDPGDLHAVDFARIFAGYFDCANVPLGRDDLANMIGSSAAHEAAHNYGLSHADGDETTRHNDETPRDNEDEWSHHLMKEGGAYDYQQRSAKRHFSDFETSALARHVGLAMDTMWTWDFTNPNMEAATKLHMELLSAEPALILSWPLEEASSPWIKPALSGPSGERVFKGKTYKVYQIEWSMANERSPTPGRVAPGNGFQVGATFSRASKTGPEAVIVSNVTLYDENGQTLRGHPQWLGFDAGTIDRNSGNLNIRFFNFLDRPLILRDVVVRDLPEFMSIKAMARNKPISDIFDRKFTPWTTRRPVLQSTIAEMLKWEAMPLDNEGSWRRHLNYTIEPNEEFKVPVANSAQGRHISVQRHDSDCLPSRASDFALKCHSGITVDDLFPATTMYITATIADPSGVESHIFYQVAGRLSRAP